MSSYAKTIVGSVAAVLIAAITAWQSATADGFRLVDLLPVGIAAAGALLTYVVPNVPELPAAKAWVSGTLAVLTALSTGLTGLSAKADAVQVVFAIAGAFLVWYTPNLPASARAAAVTDAPAGHVPAADPAPVQPLEQGPTAADLAELEAERSQMGEAVAPLPIEAEAQAAAAAQTPTA